MRNEPLPPHITRAIVIAGTWAVAAPVAWACSACIKDILSPTEFDRRAWDSSEHVFVGIVTAAAASRINEHTLDIEYRLDVEQTFKGIAADFDQRVHTTRSVPDENGIQMIACGETSIRVCDRLLVFSESDGDIAVGPCSNTRVIEGQAAVTRDEARKTLARVRRWSDAR
jgi:hypothetical protein